MEQYLDGLLILKEIDSITARITLKEDTRLKDAFELAVQEDKKRLEALKIEYKVVKEEDESVSKQLEKSRKRLAKGVTDLERLGKKCEDLEKCKNSTEPVENTEQELNEALDLKEVLRTYQELTGVRFNYSAPEDVVSGFIGIKGETESDTILEPFMFEKREENIAEKIWTKIEEAVNESVPDITEEIQCMDITSD